MALDAGRLAAGGDRPRGARELELGRGGRRELRRGPAPLGQLGAASVRRRNSLDSCRPSARLSLQRSSPALDSRERVLASLTSFSAPDAPFRASYVPEPGFLTATLKAQSRFHDPSGESVRPSLPPSFSSCLAAPLWHSHARPDPPSLALSLSTAPPRRSSSRIRPPPSRSSTGRRRPPHPPSRAQAHPPLPPPPPSRRPPPLQHTRSSSARRSPTTTMVARARAARGRGK